MTNQRGDLRQASAAAFLHGSISEDYSHLFELVDPEAVLELELKKKPPATPCTGDKTGCVKKKPKPKPKPKPKAGYKRKASAWSALPLQ